MMRYASPGLGRLKGWRGARAAWEARSGGQVVHYCCAVISSCTLFAHYRRPNREALIRHKYLDEVGGEGDHTLATALFREAPHGICLSDSCRMAWRLGLSLHWPALAWRATRGNYGDNADNKTKHKRRDSVHNHSNLNLCAYGGKFRAKYLI